MLPPHLLYYIIHLDVKLYMHILPPCLHLNSADINNKLCFHGSHQPIRGKGFTCIV